MEKTSTAAIRLQRESVETLSIDLTGAWALGSRTPSTDKLAAELKKQLPLKQVTFRAQELASWDTSLLTFLLEVRKLCSSAKISMNIEALPEGVQQLMALATAVPKKEDAHQSVSREPFLGRVGDDMIDFMRSAGELVAFIGQTAVAFGRLLTGRARFRALDLGIFLQDSGARAVPIVALISFLVGLILAFVGILQLELFGAQIYVADLVGIAMVREMGAVMTGIIMAGRTGAAFAAQLGTMQVNEEIDAFQTLGIEPVEFLVLPRMLALTFMMPFLVLFANLMGILGGALVAAGFYDINLTIYFNRTMASVGLNDLFIGLFMGLVFGVLVALSGCMRGMQCGRSASAVGDAATSAVVTSIVAIILATALITVICSVLGI
jgi:phospholipid/cholesterol/gamma-HCH transport system permease protein